MDKLSKYNTTVCCTNGKGMVVYVSTLIVEWDENFVTLNTGGWRTVTTKRKMQQASNQFGLGYSIYANKGEWFVRLRGGEVLSFSGDEIKFPRYGKLVNVA